MVMITAVGLSNKYLIRNVSLIKYVVTWDLFHDDRMELGNQ